MKERIWTLEETAEWLGVTKRTVHNMIKRGQLRAVKTSRSMVRIRPEDLEELLRRYSVGGAQ
jgi:excisionase family DNA binding protein